MSASRVPQGRGVSCVSRYGWQDAEWPVRPPGDQVSSCRRAASFGFDHGSSRSTPAINTIHRTLLAPAVSVAATNACHRWTSFIFRPPSDEIAGQYFYLRGIYLRR